MESVFSGIADHWHGDYSNTSLFSSPLPVLALFMIYLEGLFIGVCLEGFFYGKIFVSYALTCTLAKEVQLFPGHGLGLFSGIFAVYLHCSSNNSRTATILFYALCLLYVLSTTATVVCDLANVILQVSYNPICKNIFFYQLCSGV